MALCLCVFLLSPIHTSLAFLLSLLVSSTHAPTHIQGSGPIFHMTNTQVHTKQLSCSLNPCLYSTTASIAKCFIPISMHGNVEDDGCSVVEHPAGFPPPDDGAAILQQPKGSQTPSIHPSISAAQRHCVERCLACREPWTLDRIRINLSVIHNLSQRPIHDL